MATRSGKRIHKSFGADNTKIEDVNPVLKSERKTRSRRNKDVQDDTDTAIVKVRKNYVAYPSTDGEVTELETKQTVKPSRLPRKQTLREIHVEQVTTTESQQTNDIPEKPSGRQTRRTKRFADADPEPIPQPEAKKGRKIKKKAVAEVLLNEDGNEKENTEISPVPIKKSNKKNKKKGRSVSNSNQDFIETTINKTSANNISNASLESFHSAAGSPLKNKVETTETLNISVKLNGTSEKSDKETTKVIQKTPNRKSISTPMKQTTNDKLNTTFDKDDFEDEKEIALNSTFEKKTSNATLPEVVDGKNKTSPLNKTFDKDPTTDKLNNTFDQTNTEPPVNEVVNLTFDKSDNSKISISDESKSSDNILNTTPVLIESSIDESKASIESSTTRISIEEKAMTPLKREGTFTKESSDASIMSPRQNLSIDSQKPLTERQKSSSDSKKSSTGSQKTPVKTRMTMPSPGRTPFHSNTKPVKRKETILNVTHSLEKSRRSSMVDRSKNTKVMFCSPVNNPVVTARKSKVIKSSMKGSKKSFVFNDSATELPPNWQSSRKRSRSGDEAESSRAKRTRLADDLHESVNRLSRPRTSSHNPKSDAVTPSKKQPTPGPKSEGRSVRSKLPNFAALHQRRFAKMESLDECQERKAKRAKQLLAGGLNVTERSSPKAAEQKKPAVKETKAESKKAWKPEPNPEAKPGYTKFGFKINLDFNPFSIPSKNTEPKPKETNEKPVNGLKRHTAMPNKKSTLTSLNLTVPRKEAAKIMVLREKPSATLKDLRDNKRKENRTIIKGVRTNRRFELQMQSRNIAGQ